MGRVARYNFLMSTDSDYGVDIATTEDGDLSPRLAQATGREILIDALIRRALEAPGGLWYDPEYGAGLSDAVNGDWSARDTSAMSSKLESQFLKDDRVEAARVTLTYSADSGEVSVKASVEDGEGPFEFTFTPAEAVERFGVS